MADFIIDNTTVSYEDAKTELQNFVDAMPDADEWSVFFASASGQKLVELIAGLLAFMKYDSVTARREAFLQYALGRSSQLGGAQNLGYSAYRGRNAVLKLNVTPSSTGVWAKYDIIGTVKDRDLIVLADTPYNSGVALDVDVVIGGLNTEEIVATTSSLDVFRFTQKNVSEDLRIFIDGTEVPYTKTIVDLLSGNFVLQSNPFGSVDAKYLNYLTFASRYNTGSIIKLEWVDLKNTIFTESNVVLDAAEGVLNTVEITSLFDAQETASSIKINAPLQNETKFVIRAREDQPKILTQIDTKISDATGEDVTAAIMRLFYLRSDDLRFTLTEKDALINQMNSYRPHGMKPVLIGDPVRIAVRLKIDIDLSGTTGDPVNDTKAITQALAYKLKGLINLKDLEALIEALATVKIARIAFNGDSWVTITSYEVGQHAKASPDNGRIYQVLEILYSSSGSEPTWPTVANTTVTDGDIVWNAIPKDDPSGDTDWAATTVYRVGNQVRPTTPNGFIYEVAETLNASDSAEPTWTPLGGGTAEDHQGELVQDGDIVWVARPTEGTPAAWTADTIYRIGDLVEATDTGASDTIGVMWQAYTYIGKSDVSQPTFLSTLGTTVIDGNLNWICQDPSQEVSQLNPNQYYTITEEITVT